MRDLCSLEMFVSTLEGGKCFFSNDSIGYVIVIDGIFSTSMNFCHLCKRIQDTKNTLYFGMLNAG